VRLWNPAVWARCRSPKNNGIDPQALIDEYGADTARLFIMFASPPEQSLEWSDAGVEGAFRFLKRVWNFCLQFQQAPSTVQASSPSTHPELRREVHAILKQANYDFQKFQFNTVVSAAMKILNALERASRPAGSAELVFTPALVPVVKESLSDSPASAGTDHPAHYLSSLARAGPGYWCASAKCFQRALADRR
jgi:leucyl-tRNA synthetase